jgi:hypothetical protein
MRALSVSALTAVFGLIVVNSAAAQPIVKSSSSNGAASVTFGMLSQPTIDWEQVGDGDAQAACTSAACG